MTGINLSLVFLFVFSAIGLQQLFSAPNKWKALLITSLVFYGVLIGQKIIVVLILCALVYLFSHADKLLKTKIWLPVGFLVMLLIIFKVSVSQNHFTNYSIEKVDFYELPNWYSWVQVIGLSYFVFNAISYLIDIKRQYVKPEKNFLLLTLYLIYFPAIFSGPLHRAKYLIDQFRYVEVTHESFSRGGRLMLWGLFKNIVIAKSLFTILFKFQQAEITGLYSLILGLLFFLYLYCNFSSFIDFFQGVSQLFSIRLKSNFGNRIYLSASRQEFWKGWHITLNSWFRDYFFFVVSKMDKKRRFTDLLLLLTFILIAMWHEISAVLLVWGLFNGLWIVMEKKFDFNSWHSSQYRKFLGICYHLIFSSLLALIFISPDLSFLFERLVLLPSKFPIELLQKFKSRLVLVLIAMVVMDYHYRKAKNARFDDYLHAEPRWYRWGVYVKLVILILALGNGGSIQNYYIRF